MNHFTRKKLLAGALVACVCSAAGAADKAPALADVLKASGIDVNGYVDVSYQNKTTDAQATTFHNYDTEQKSFNLHALDVSISSLPASGFGGLLELQFGTDAAVNAPVSNSPATNADALQAYLQYSSGPWSAIAGKFLTLAGAEVAQGPANTNFSRSFLFTFAEPTTHVGVRTGYTVSDALKFNVGLNNGWNIMNENAPGNCAGPGGTPPCADGKTLELGVTATPSKLLNLVGVFHTGDEKGSAGQVGNRQMVDVVATVNLSDALNLVFNYDDVEQDKAVASGKAKWNGLASYVNYKINDAWRLSARVEQFNDKQGFRTNPTTVNPALAAGTGQKLKEVTITAGYAIAKNAELRFELRNDKSDQNVFLEDGAFKKTQDALAVEAIYKF